MTEKTSFLLITVDALRADHLGCYGYHRNTSPSIDEFARNGVVFQSAFTSSTLTVSALPTVFTSTIPSAHGCLAWGPELNRIDSNLENIAQSLKANNYHTAFFSNHGALDSIQGFKTGWDVWLDESVGAHDLTTLAIEWLDSNQGKPVFLWLHYIEPHFPYSPPAEYKTQFLESGITDQEVEEWYEIHAWRMGRDEITAYEYLRSLNPIWLDFVVSQYDGEIRLTDQAISRLVSKFQEHSSGSRFLVIISADHGESFGERNGSFFHGGPPIEPVLRVPLVLYGPGVVPKGVVAQHSVGLIDIMPTILDVAGLAIPRRCGGSSLLNAEGQPDASKDRLFVSQTLDERRLWVSVRDQQTKLISAYERRKLVSQEFYYLDTDPRELRNRFDPDDPAVQKLLESLDGLIGPEILAKIDEHLAEPLETSDIASRLKALGYSK